MILSLKTATTKNLLQKLFYQIDEVSDTQSENNSKTVWRNIFVLCCVV